MPFLTFKHEADAIPVARVHGNARSSAYHGQILYVVMRRPTQEQMTRDGDPVCVTLDENHMFVPLPTSDPRKRDVVSFCGAAGSGKSYAAASFATEYQRMWPDRSVYLVTLIDEDPAFDEMDSPPKRVDVDQLIDASWEEFCENPCLVIFDDCESLQGELGKKVQHLTDQLLMLARKKGVSVLMCEHLLTNYKKSRIRLLESNVLCIYPEFTSFSTLRHVLEAQVGLTSQQVRDLRRFGRWSYIHKNVPTYMLCPQYCELLNEERPDEND
jgi:hypothetical protein